MEVRFCKAEKPGRIKSNMRDVPANPLYFGLLAELDDPIMAAYVHLEKMIHARLHGKIETDWQAKSRLMEFEEVRLPFISLLRGLNDADIFEA